MLGGRATAHPYKRPLLRAAGIVPEAPRTSGLRPGAGGAAPYAPDVDDEQRARDRERRLRARNERRRAQGKPTWEPRAWPPPQGAAGGTILVPPVDPDQATIVVPPPAAADAWRHGSFVVDSTPRRLALSTAIFSVATALSRVMGLVREIVATYYFGARGPINAFTVAFQLPNLVRALVADAALS